MKILILALALFTGNAFACSCGEWGTAEEMLADSRVVSFVGTFNGATKGEINPETGLPFLVSKFKVLRAFKPRPMRVLTETRSDKGDGANCGTNFVKGKRYLVFAFRSGRNVYTDACSYQEINRTAAQNEYLRQLDIAAAL